MEIEAITAGKKIGYSWEKKTDVVKKWLVHGNLRSVSELTGVGYETLCNWRKTDWWNTLETELRFEEEMKLAAKLKRLTEKSLEIIEERLENGQLTVVKGEPIHLPISISDANKIADNLLTKQIALTKIKKEEIRQNNTMQDTLKVLAKEFAKWNLQQSKNTAETIEYVEEIEDAIHEESPEIP
jgi:hypothetical protein